MNTVGIVAEYNPFHNGHCHHLEKALAGSGSETAVAVMSGNFTQRGEPAIFSKWIRGEMAVRNGVSLAVELPFIYACNSAEYFAKGGVSILDKLGCVTHIAFGSECGTLKDLKKLAEILTAEGADYRAALKDHLTSGISYPKARQNAVEAVMGKTTAGLLRHSNNILVVEYLKQLIVRDSSMIPVLVERKGNGYLDRGEASPFASAMAVRSMILNGENPEHCLPKATTEVIGTNTFGRIERKAERAVCFEDFSDILKYRLLSMSGDELGKILSVNEGLENRVFKALKKNVNLPEPHEGMTAMSPKSDVGEIEVGWVRNFVSQAVSKRYTETRIQRILIHSLMGLTKESFDRMDGSGQIYGRVLGADCRGLGLLKKIKANACDGLAILTKNKSGAAGLTEVQGEMLEMDSKASDIYSIAAGKTVYEGSDFTRQFYIEGRE